MLLSPSSSDLTFFCTTSWGEEELSDAADVFVNQGVVHLRGPLIPSTLLNTLRVHCEKIVDETLSLLDNIGVDYTHQQQPFAFKEAASRCRGRIDIRHPDLQLAPFNHEHLVKNTIIARLLDRIFDGAYQLSFSGIVHSLPGSEAQGWHLDGDHLFKPWQLPAHAVTVFIPLSGLEPCDGIPQFIPGSHHHEVYRSLKEGTRTVAPISFEHLAGSITIFDYRTVHRGMPNLSDRARPLLYMVFAKPWYRDAANFSKQSLFQMANKMMDFS